MQRSRHNHFNAPALGRSGPLRAFPVWILDLKRVPANGATKVGLGIGSHDLRTAAETAKLMKIVVHAQVINYPDASVTAQACLRLLRDRPMKHSSPCEHDSVGRIGRVRARFGAFAVTVTLAGAVLSASAQTPLHRGRCRRSETSAAPGFWNSFRRLPAFTQRRPSRRRRLLPRRFKMARRSIYFLLLT